MADSTDVHFQFGSIELTNVLTREYREEEVTDPSGTDVIAVRHSVVVQGTLAKGLVPAEGGEDGRDVLATLRRYLLRHRRYFLYSIAGKKIIEVGDSSKPDDPAANIDASNGPRCVWVSATNIAEACVTVECRVEATVVPCPEQSRSVISHRFSQREEYDKAGYCTLTTSGLIVTRSDVVKSPNAILEGAGLPRIRDGYRCEGKSFQLSEDGCRFMYQIVDMEYHARPPGGVVEADGNFVIVTGPSGSGAYANVTVKVKGFKGMKRYDLYILANRIVNSKVDAVAAIGKDGKAASTSLTVAQELYDGVVEIKRSVLADEKRIREGDGIGAWKKELFQGYDWRPGGKPDFPVPLNADQVDAFKAANPDDKVQSARPEVLRDGQLVDMLRAALQEPCDDLAVVRSPVTKTRPGSPAGMGFGGLGGGVVTPGPVAGGGGIFGGGGGGGLPGRVLTDDEILILFGIPRPQPSTTPYVLPATVLDALRTEYDAQTGTGYPYPFAAGSSAPRPDPADVDLPYTSYLIRIDHDLKTGDRLLPSAGPW